MLTYEKIIKESRDFATNHNQISSFDNGDMWEVVQHNKLQDYSYPLLFMNDGTSNVSQGLVTFSFNILSVDQVLNGEVNENFVKSSMHQILLDYLAYFKHTYLYDIEGSKLTFNIESTAQMNSFTERFTDTLTGWNMSVVFRIPFDASKCNIPLHSVPLPPEPFICSVDATVENSQGTLIASKTVTSLDSVIDIPNITLTDSDGTTRSEPSGVNLVCTPQDVMTVDFTADKVEVEIGEDVTFTDATTESPTEWAWDFGDNTASSLQNPVKNWATAGTFDIRLLAAKMGLGGFAKKLAYITVNNLFRPTDLAGTQLYFAKNTATPSLWNDQSPNGYDLSQATAIQQPTIGTDTVNFDGVNDFMRRSVTNPFIADNLGIFFMSFEFVSGEEHRFSINNISTSFGNNSFQIAISSTGKLNFQIRDFDRTINNTIESTNSVNIGYNYISVSTDGFNYFFKINGVLTTFSILAGTDTGEWLSSIDTNSITLGLITSGLTNIYSPDRTNKLYYTNILPSPTNMAKLETFFSDPNKY